MSSGASNRSRRRLVWRFAALWMVVLALGLAVTGMVLAVQHASLLAKLLMAPVEAQAGRIARDTARQFDARLRDGLDAVAEHLRNEPDRPWIPPRDFPTWLDGLFVWDGEMFRVVTQPSSPSEEVLTLARTRLSVPFSSTSPPVGLFAGGPSLPMGIDPQLLYETVNGDPVVLAFFTSFPPIDVDVQSVLVVAANINLERLKTGLVEPMLPVETGLELVPAVSEAPHRPWSQRLFRAMRFWAIKPTEAFVREQSRAVVGQTLVYLGLTVLALATLLIAMWVLARVVRREMALAEMKANFVADVSHELKTPLALIRMFAETLQSGRVPSDQKRQEYYTIINRESTRLTNLIENILDFSRIEAGRKEYSLEPIGIADVVRQTYEAYRVQLDHNRFEHHLTIESSLPSVDADGDAIAQALINLINNAIKYAGDERYLSIDVARDTRRGRHGVLISLHDRGIGIQPEDRGRLFDGFFRSSDDRVRAQGGAGLGLALVKHIVDAHGGSLDVESRLVKGSTFRIFLPASERPGVAEQGQS